MSFYHNLFFTHDILLKFIPIIVDDAGVQDSSGPDQFNDHGLIGRYSHYKAETVVRPSQLSNGNLYTSRDPGTYIGAEPVLVVSIKAFHSRVITGKRSNHPME